MPPASEKLSDQELHSLLKEEYLRIQAFTQSFDDKAITVKAWSVTFSLASIIGAFATHSQAVILVAGLSAVAFWLTEGYIRAYQYAYYDRAGVIEKYFSGERGTISPLQTGSSWASSFAKIGFLKLVKILLWPEVLLPHALPIVISVVLFPLVALGVLSL